MPVFETNRVETQRCDFRYCYTKKKLSQIRVPAIKIQRARENKLLFIVAQSSALKLLPKCSFEMYLISLFYRQEMITDYLRPEKSN